MININSGVGGPQAKKKERIRKHITHAQVGIGSIV